jgi:HNH endonuclease
MALPRNKPPAIPDRTSSLTTVKDKHEKARKISLTLKKSYDAISEKVDDMSSGDETASVVAGLRYEQLTLGIKLAEKVQDEIRLERDVVREERAAGIISDSTAQERYRGLNRRCVSAGDDLWRHVKKKYRIDDPGAVQLMPPGGGSGIAECLLILYRKSDGQGKGVLRRRPSHWREDVEDYYLGAGEDHGKEEGLTWCHISGTWNLSANVKAAHIVPFFLNMDKLSEILFGTQSDSLEKGGNALLMSNTIEPWFDKYLIVVVPVDPKEEPITRWKTEVLSSDIKNMLCTVVDRKRYTGRELDGKELVFIGKARPVSRFLYFHFIMALVRIKDLERRGWQDIWARYYQRRLFPTPGNYMRKAMLLALATHFEVADIKVVESWIADHGFETPLMLQDDQAKEVARRVHEAVEEAVARAEEDILMDQFDDS